MIISKIQIKEYLKEWVMGRFPVVDGAVRFPDDLDLYHTIYDLLQKRPKNIGVDKGNLAIILPERENGKKTSSYNYLSERATRIIEKRLTVKFWAELHDLIDEQKHVLNIEYIDTVFNFLAKYKIESISDDALLKNYYRWRVNARKKFKRNYSKKNS